ncbi:uncharacterized protein LOC118567017 [Fundulus heteroclitus]|uniref:uncharacterized protein LOC118567017 n=1 Tax=Fundulus heteroclitus TaxID=8078 RepID=UPI00165BA40C|nr:uncharacterized protein LOC118567017 [Fundulus heteroclitus]
MADQTAGKSIEQLKVERTTAKRSFSRLVNSIKRNHMDMSEEELKDSFNKLGLDAEKVMTANDDLESGIIAQLEAEKGSELGNDEAVVPEHQQADLENTVSECEGRLKEVKSLIQNTLWSSFGEAEVSMAIQIAETECERAAAFRPDVEKEAYIFILNHLKELVNTAKEVHSRWKRWIPQDAQKVIQDKLRGIDCYVPRLVSRTAEFIQTKIKMDDQRQTEIGIYSNYPLPAIKLKPTALPRFSGNKRDFFRWKSDWEALQKQGEPTGSAGVKKVQLLDSLEEKLIKDLRLTSYNTADDIFRVLENRYGNRTVIAIEIVEELQSVPAVRGNQPRRIVELIQVVEKALKDLSDLGDTGAIKNPLVTRSIESKLPETLKKEWLVYAADKRNSVTPESRFDNLLAFLKEQESIYEQLAYLREEEPSRRETRMEPRYARTKTVKGSSEYTGCIVCGDTKHRKRLYFCKQFRTLTISERNAAVRKLGACRKCLEVHDEDSCCKSGFLCRNQSCRGGGYPEHHYHLCPNAEGKKINAAQRRSKVGPEENKGARTEDQEDFLKKLSPELAKQLGCKNFQS